MKNILLTLIILIFSSCKSEKKEIPDAFKDSNLHLVEFLERKIYLPKEYEKSSVEEITTLLQNSPNIDKFSDYRLYQLEKFKQMEDKIEIFVEKNNLSNYITFNTVNYFDFEKDALPLYVDLLENRIFVEPRKQGIIFERLESKFIKYGTSKILKVKYHQTFNNEKRFLTQYLITSKLRTFAIIVINEKNEDYQYILMNFPK